MQQYVSLCYIYISGCYLFLVLYIMSCKITSKYQNHNIQFEPPDDGFFT